MIVCVPVEGEAVDPRWGRASQVALATVEDGLITEWRQVAVDWDSLHDAASEAAHHARIARFLREHHVDVVVAHHVGAGMSRMLETMHITARLGASGDARRVVESAVSQLSGTPLARNERGAT